MSSDLDNKRRENKKIVMCIMMISQIGVSTIVSIFICMVVGIFLENKMEWEYSVPISIAIGIVVAFRNAYILTKKIYFKDLKKENKELLYFKEMETERNLNFEKAFKGEKNE